MRKIMSNIVEKINGTFRKIAFNKITIYLYICIIWWFICISISNIEISVKFMKGKKTNLYVENLIKI